MMPSNAVPEDFIDEQPAGPVVATVTKPSALLSDEPTLELVVQARNGNRLAAEALLERCLPQVRRWAHGRLPSGARGHLDTGDLVHDAALHLLRRLDVFEPRHVGAMQAYLRQAIINRIRDEVRRIGRRPPMDELPEDCHSDRTSPIEFAIRREAYDRYRQALTGLKTKDRELVIARVEVQWSCAEIAERFGMPTVAAAGMAVKRALDRLLRNIAEQS
jgi:RNA polymerase sigma-70 factor (ECF subfamily)